jgi:hypothetical protein
MTGPLSPPAPGPSSGSTRLRRVTRADQTQPRDHKGS